MKKENKSDHFINSSGDLWRYLIEKAGIDTNNYDFELVEQLSYELFNRPLTEDFALELEKENISIERFVRSFFNILQPYAKMMEELCIFFEEHSVKETNQSLKILFDFGQGYEDVGFDLEHFKETLAQFTSVKRKLTQEQYDANQLWELWRVFREYSIRTYENDTVKKWIEAYEKRDFMAPPIVEMDSTGIEALDSSIQRVIHVWKHFVNRCRKQSESVKELRELSSAEYYGKTETTHEINIAGLAGPLSDHWPKSVVEFIANFIETIKGLSSEIRIQLSVQVTNNLDHIFKDIHLIETEEDFLMQEFIDLLNLPVWKRRSELYQTWTIAIIDKAFFTYKREVHHENGKLTLRFSGTHVATIETRDGPLQLWSEWKSQVENPKGKSRKANIQPDYSIYKQTSLNPGNCVAVVECKQYNKPQRKNFSDAINDYAKGRINAHIFLTNYGPMPRVLDIESTYAGRAHYFGNVHPGKNGNVEFFINALKGILPVPASVVGKLNIARIEFVAIDISGSMNDILSNLSIVAKVEKVLCDAGKGRLLAFDEEVRKEWSEINSFNFGELLSVERSKGTSLALALAKETISNSIIITDEDGVGQIMESGLRPAGILRLDASGEMQWLKWIDNNYEEFD